MYATDSHTKQRVLIGNVQGWHVTAISINIKL